MTRTERHYVTAVILACFAGVMLRLELMDANPSVWYVLFYFVLAIVNTFVGLHCVRELDRRGEP